MRRDVESEAASTRLTLVRQLWPSYYIIYFLTIHLSSIHYRQFLILMLAWHDKDNWPQYSLKHLLPIYIGLHQVLCTYTMAISLVFYGTPDSDSVSGSLILVPALGSLFLLLACCIYFDMIVFISSFYILSCHVQLSLRSLFFSSETEREWIRMGGGGEEIEGVGVGRTVWEKNPLLVKGKKDIKIGNILVSDSPSMEGQDGTVRCKVSQDGYRQMAGRL